jgi:Trypsin-co-occurring domain 1
MEVPLIGVDESELRAAATEARVDPKRIREQLEQIRDDLAPMMNGGATGIPLKSVAVELGITVGGEVGFIVKATIEVGATITLTFER